MNQALERFRRKYSAALLQYLDDPVESGLATAYELGREGMTEKLSSLDIAQVHHDSLTEGLLRAANAGPLSPEKIERIMKAATTFRLESISIFEIMQRGYFEAQQLYQRERDVAQSLSESLLPHSLPAIPGMEVEAHYRPGGSGNQVGGDFYDVFQTGTGRWGILLGDVCGKGAAAAAVTAMARHTARAAILQRSHPTDVLQLVNRAFLSFGSDFFCTMIHAQIEKTAFGARMTLATGGHPSPFRLSSAGVVSKVAIEGPLLGVIDDWMATPTVLDLEAGDSVLLYTDGVTEARMPDGFFGDRGLIAALETCAGYDAMKTVTTIADALSQEKESPRRDDMAILALRVLP